MKKRKAIFSLFLAMLLFAAVGLTGAAPAKAAGGAVDLGDVIELGDFDILSGYVVFYPKTLEKEENTFPVAVWANGTMCPPVLYTDLLHQVAAKGYVVVASSDMMSGDGESLSDAIDYIIGESMKEDSVFFGKIDPNRIGAFGHSQGGRGVVNGAVKDDRIGCVVSVAGSSYSSEAAKLSAPALFLTGTLDSIVWSSVWVKPAYKKCTGPAVYASLKGGLHLTCTTNAEYYADYCASWFDAWLNGDAAAKKKFVAGGELSKDGNWTDFASKNMESSLTGTMIGGGNLLMLLVFLEAAVIAGLIVALVAKKKKEKSNE